MFAGQVSVEDQLLGRIPCATGISAGDYLNALGVVIFFTITCAASVAHGFTETVRHYRYKFPDMYVSLYLFV